MEFRWLEHKDLVHVKILPNACHCWRWKVVFNQQATRSPKLTTLVVLSSLSLSGFYLDTNTIVLTLIALSLNILWEIEKNTEIEIEKHTDNEILQSQVRHTVPVLRCRICGNEASRRVYVTSRCTSPWRS